MAKVSHRSNTELAEKGWGSVRSYGADISLRDWLEVDWIYPPGFDKEKLIETDESIIVVGREQVFKFHKHTDSPEDGSFSSKWSSACQSVIDGAYWAPSNFLGLLVVDWSEDGPVWVQERPLPVFDISSPPENGVDVAVVMKRVQSSRRLDYLLENDELVEKRHAQQIANRLDSLHQIESDLLDDSFLNQSERSIEQKLEVFSGNLKEFIDEHRKYLDHFSLVAFEEAYGFIMTWINRNLGVLLKRVSKGKFVNCHGELTMARVCLQKEEILFLGRSSRNHELRVQDVTSDLASLCLDLDVHGHRQFSREIEKAYFNINTESEEQVLYSFYRVALACLRAKEHFLVGPKNVPLAAKYLAIESRRILNLPERCAVGVIGQNIEKISAISTGVSEFIGTSVLQVDDPKFVFTDSECADDLNFDDLLRLLEQKLRYEEQVVFQFSSLDQNKRESLGQLFLEHNVSHLILHTDTPDTRTHTSQSFTHNVLREFPIEVALRLPELSVMIMRQLGMQNSLA